MSILTYIFYPNPGNAWYTSPKAMTLLIVCAVMVLGSFAIAYWRRRQENQILRRLSRSWSKASFWFGITGLILIVARVEGIQYVAMRFWWLVWIVMLGLYLFLQYRLFRAKYYEVIPSSVVEDPRDKYLPRRKHR